MAANAATLNEPDHRAGTTWRGYTLTFLDSEQEPIDFTGAVARMTWRDSSEAIVMDWTAAAGIDFDADPTLGILYVRGPGVIDVATGMLRYDLKIWMDSGDVFVDLDGHMKIVKGQTQEMPT